jgi:hypothetical protein
MPQIGQQDTKCCGASFAWALQYSITAADVLVNNRPDANQAAISAQFFLDCTEDNTPYVCFDKVFLRNIYKMIVNRKIPLVNQWKNGYVTGTPGSCSNGVNESSVNQPVNSALVTDYENVWESDGLLEKGMATAPVISRLWINKKIVQFYQKGVVSD